MKRQMLDLAARKLRLQPIEGSACLLR